MLTPAKIKSHQFDNSGRNAYKAESVDSFFAEVTESYEQMFRENGEMYKKIGLLAERLEEYRKDEDNIRNALLTAQRMADKITRDAQEKADSLLAEAEERAKTENDRIDAISNDMLQKANYQAQAIVNDAQHQAEKIIEDATLNSKEAAISARDSMIKEEAALQMMKVEVTKFKKQIMDAYSEQLALIEELPEIVYAKIEEEKAAAEEAAKEEAEAKAEAVEEPEEAETEEIEETFEETVEDAIEEIADEEITEEEDDEKTVAPDVYFTKADKQSAIDVETLQEMIADEDAVVEYVEEEYETEEAVVEESSYVLPDIDAIDEEIERLSREISEKENAEEYADEFEDELDDEYDDDNEYDDEEDETEETPDIPFTKPMSKKNENGFKVNFENVSVYGDAEEVDDDDEYDDEYDDDDDEEDDGEEKKDNGNEGGFSSKLKGFFRK